MVRSPSELARLEGEFVETVSYFLAMKGSRSSREAILNNIRTLENRLGHIGHNYNNVGFRPYYEKKIKELTV